MVCLHGIVSKGRVKEVFLAVSIILMYISLCDKKIEGPKPTIYIFEPPHDEFEKSKYIYKYHSSPATQLMNHEAMSIYYHHFKLQVLYFANL